MRREFARWDDIDVHFRGDVITSGGHGFAAMSRRRLLAILQRAAPSWGYGSCSAPRRRTSRTWRRATTWWSPPTA